MRDMASLGVLQNAIVNIRVVLQSGIAGSENNDCLLYKDAECDEIWISTYINCNQESIWNDRFCIN